MGRDRKTACLGIQRREGQFFISESHAI
jgi:hypothetical protein